MPLLVNYQKMRMSSSSKIYMYAVTFGPDLDTTDFKAIARCYRSMREAL